LVFVHGINFGLLTALLTVGHSMATGRISKTAVDTLVCGPEKDREVLWDDKNPGFGVVAYPSGAKVYVVQYRTAGRSHRVKLGRHGKITPDQARDAAKVMLGKIVSGDDPAAVRRDARSAPTLNDVAADFLKFKTAKKKPGTVKGYESALRVHIPPELGKLRITDIRKTDLQRLHTKLSDKPYRANRTVAILSSLFTWAVDEGLLPAATNPVHGVKLNPEAPRERFLKSDELARLGDILTRGEVGEGASRRKLDPFAVAAIRLLIFTGARLREILHAKWTEVDVDRGMIFLPDSKTGAKPIYLSTASLAILATLPRLKGSPYVIPGEKDGKPRYDLRKPWAAICEAAGLQGLRIHDLRHSFASVGAGASLGLPIIGKLLGHAQAATTNRYAHVDDDPMRRAVETIGASISKAMDVRKEK